MIGLGSFKEHLGSACPAGRRALQHSFAGLDFSVFTGRCQPCMAVCVQGRRPLSFIRQKDGLHSTCGAGGTQCQTRCHIDLLQKFPREGTVYVAHSQRFLLYPSPLGHQSCPPRAVQCPNTVWPLHFSLSRQAWWEEVHHEWAVLPFPARKAIHLHWVYSLLW